MKTRRADKNKSEEKVGKETSEPVTKKSEQKAVKWKINEHLNGRREQKPSITGMIFH